MIFKCNYSLGNTGIGCTPLFKVLKKLIFVPYFDSTGVQNTVTLSGGPFNSAYWSALINQADGSKRWYPTPFLKNAVNKRAESQTQSFDDGSRIIVEQGIRKLTAIIVGKDASPQLLGQLKTLRLLEVGFYGVDKDDNLVGVVNTAGKLDPIRLDPNSFDPIFNGGDDKMIQEIMINADIHASELDENLRILAGAEIASPVSLVTGLLDVFVEFSNMSTTGLTASLYTRFGTALNKLPVKGLVAADFVSGTSSKIRNTTQNTDIALTSATEGVDSQGQPNGEYALVFGAQASADSMQIKPVKAGFDFSQVAAARAVLP